MAQRVKDLWAQISKFHRKSDTVAYICNSGAPKGKEWGRECFPRPKTNQSCLQGTEHKALSQTRWKVKNDTELVLWPLHMYHVMHGPVPPTHTFFFNLGNATFYKSYATATTFIWKNRWSQSQLHLPIVTWNLPVIMSTRVVSVKACFCGVGPEWQGRLNITRQVWWLQSILTNSLVSSKVCLSHRNTESLENEPSSIIGSSLMGTH